MTDGLTPSLTQRDVSADGHVLSSPGRHWSDRHHGDVDRVCWVTCNDKESTFNIQYSTIIYVMLIDGGNSLEIIIFFFKKLLQIIIIH